MFLISTVINSAGVSAETCYEEDLAILGGGNVLISNVLRCTSESSIAESGITDCMRDTYPAYGSVSDTCLECTTIVMESDVGIRCLPNCVNQLGASACIQCAPDLVEAWSHQCNVGGKKPADHDTQENVDPKCTVADKQIVQSGSNFVVGSLNCLTDLSTFQTCLYGLVPLYNSISAGCKACASALNTQSNGQTIQAQDCGAICMQDSVDATRCAQCASGLAQAFDRECMSSASLARPLGTALVVILIALLN